MSLELLSASANYVNWNDLHVGPIAFQIGSFAIRWYSLGYLAGILLGYWMLSRMIKRPGSPMSQTHADDMILYATLGIILGGRLGYAIFYDPALLTSVDIFKLWEGGMSLHGGTIGTIFAIWLFARRHKLSFLRMCDYIACVIPFGLFLVRLANFANGELWGRVTDVSWAIRFNEKINGTYMLGPPRHPSQLYEAAMEGVLMAAIMWPLFWKTDARYKPGFLFGTAALIYGLSRFTLEFFREPDVQLQWLADQTGLSMGQWLTIPMIVLGLFLVATASRRRQRVEPIAGSNSVA